MIGRLIGFALALVAPSLASADDASPPATVVVAFDRESITPLIVEGVRNFESGEPVEANDPVRIASISKLIMALATLRVMDEGKVDLDADVSDYLGWKVRSPHHPDAKVTLDLLLSHRAGLRDTAGYVIPFGESLEEKLKEPEAWYADAPPGEAPFQYANLGSPIVATVLEAATGERYDKLLRRTVFDPIGVDACINWVGCSDDMVARAVALYRHTGEPAVDYPDALPPACTIPVAEGQPCSLDDYVPGTNASVFSPQGGVRIGMMDLAKVGQTIIRIMQGEFLSDKALTRWSQDFRYYIRGQQEFFCVMSLGLQLIPSKAESCDDDLFKDGRARIGHAGQAYGLESGLWVNWGNHTSYAFFHTQAPPPVAGEDTGGFTRGEIDLMRRAQELLATKGSN